MEPEEVLEEFGGIFPPYEAFYIASMLHVTGAALDSCDRLSAGIQCFSDISSEYDFEAFDEDEVLYSAQDIITQAAALSRYFWPMRAKTKLHKLRADFLRKVFGMEESNVIRSREMRNLIEHFDERLDTFLARPIAGNFVPEFVGPTRLHDPNITVYFRAYDTEKGIFFALGECFVMEPIIDEILRIHEMLKEFLNNGHRFRLPEP